MDRAGEFYAQHPELVKGLGAAALAIALGRMHSGSAERALAPPRRAARAPRTRRGPPPQAVRITVMCSVPLSGSQTSPARPRIWRTRGAFVRQRDALERLAAGIEAEDRVAAEVAQPDHVALVDVDRVRLRVVARQLPGAPGRLRRVVHREVAAQPFADPDAARLSLQTRRAPWFGVGGSTTVESPRRAVDAGDERAGERARTRRRRSASCRCRRGRGRAARP